MINITQLIADFGAYYRPGTQNEQNLIARLYRSQKGMSQVLSQMTTEFTRFEVANVAMSEVLQGYQDQFTPKGQATFTPHVIDLDNLKIDYQINPNALKYSWLAFMEQNNRNPDDYPIVAYVVEEHLIPKMEEELDNALYAGAKVTPVAGTATTSLGSMNGVRRKINQAITAGKITPIATGAPASTPEAFVEQIEAFARSVDKRYWMQTMTLNMNEDLAMRFATGMRLKYNQQYFQESDLYRLPQFNITVRGQKAMLNSNKIWMTPTGNAVELTKKPAGLSGFNVQVFDRFVKFLTDFYKGVGFLDESIVFTNDQDLV